MQVQLKHVLAMCVVLTCFGVQDHLLGMLRTFKQVELSSLTSQTPGPPRTLTAMMIGLLCACIHGWQLSASAHLEQYNRLQHISFTSRFSNL